MLPYDVSYDMFPVPCSHIGCSFYSIVVAAGSSSVMSVVEPGRPALATTGTSIVYTSVPPRSTHAMTTSGIRDEKSIGRSELNT